MSKPITPSEVKVERYIPPEVYEAFNKLINANYKRGSAKVDQEQVIELIMEALLIDREEIFKKGYLDVEEAYRAADWIVTYEKPGYNVSYNAFFVFKNPNP